MTWRRRTNPRTVYRRNALLSVVCELRFQPVLVISQGEGIPQLQEAVRRSLPKYRVVETTTVTMEPPARSEQPSMPAISMTREKQHRFTTEDGTTTLVLGSRSLALDCRRYITREEFFPLVVNAVDALGHSYRSIEPLRLGLRYQNSLSLGRLKADLGRDVPETEVLGSGYTQRPTDLADMIGTKVTTEIRSPLEGSNGHMTLRYGFTPNPADGPVCSIDIDRYIDAGIKLSDLNATLIAFSEDISALFDETAGPAWKEWMQPIKGEGAT